MSNLKSITALTLTAFMLVACNGDEEASAPSTTDQTATTTTASTTPVTTALPTNAPTTTALAPTSTPTTSIAPATTATSPSSSSGSGSGPEAITDDALADAFEQYLSFRSVCYEIPGDCAASTFEERSSGRLLQRDISFANELDQAGVTAERITRVDSIQISPSASQGEIEICDGAMDREGNVLRGPIVRVLADYQDDRWVMVDFESIDTTGQTC